MPSSSSGIAAGSPLGDSEARGGEPLPETVNDADKVEECEPVVERLP